jgi:hypothetical protein
MASPRRDLEKRANPSMATGPRPASSPAWPKCVASSRPRPSLVTDPDKPDGFRPADAVGHSGRTPNPALIFLEGTRRPSGIVPAMQPCTSLNRLAAPPMGPAQPRPAEGRRRIALRLRPPGTNTTQEEMHGFEASAPLPGHLVPRRAATRLPSSDAAIGRADGNHTVNIKMLSEIFCVPTSGTYQLASHIIMTGCNSLNGAADARGR